MALSIPSFAIALRPGQLPVAPASCMDTADVVNEAWRDGTGWMFTFRHEWEHGQVGEICDPADVHALVFLALEVCILEGEELARAHDAVHRTFESLTTNERYIEGIVEYARAYRSALERTGGLPAACEEPIDESRSERSIQDPQQLADWVETTAKLSPKDRWEHHAVKRSKLEERAAGRGTLNEAVLPLWKAAASKAIAHAVARARPMRKIHDELGPFRSDLESFACYLVSLREALREARSGTGRLLHVQFQP